MERTTEERPPVVGQPASNESGGGGIRLMDAVDRGVSLGRVAVRGAARSLRGRAGDRREE